MASKRQLGIASETLRWNILEMIALEEELELEAIGPEAEGRIARRLERLKEESPGLATELEAGVIAWREGAPMSPSSD
jgi:hypothetical protein